MLSVKRWEHFLVAGLLNRGADGLTPNRAVSVYRKDSDLVRSRTRHHGGGERIPDIRSGSVTVDSEVITE
jgi:hypothetical protein